MKLKRAFCSHRAIGFFISSLLSLSAISQKIDRKSLVERHRVINTNADTLSSLSVGNGRFAFTVDVTGLQSFPVEYSRGIPLGTESEWGWHSFINSNAYKREEALKTYHLNGRDITYAVEVKTPERNKAAASWFRQNPHRLQLGNLGFDIRKKDGSHAGLQDIEDIHQILNPWTGEIKSHFSVEGTPVDVSTFCNQQEDVLSVKVVSALIKQGRLNITLKLPYPTGEWSDVGTNYTNDDKHTSTLNENEDDSATILHVIDTTKYFIKFNYHHAGIKQAGPHYFVITPGSDSDSFEFSCGFFPEKPESRLPGYTESRNSNISGWRKFWMTTAAVDFSGSTDTRAAELERRIILSLYLIRIQDVCNDPPQETGLTYNSWFGKPHMEMPYWHLGYTPYWGQQQYLEKMMHWYFKSADKAKQLAARQGFEGMRWPKVTDNNGDESPSSVGAFLIWDEPHMIYFAESIYRQQRDVNILNRYKDLVFGTADFMASYPFYEKEHDRFILGKGVIPAQERFKAEETFNPTYELVYWHWALDIAQQWRQRLHLPRNPKWDTVLKKLSGLPVSNNVYLATESATDSYTNPAYLTDHPSVLMAFGVLPATGQVDKQIMKNTFNEVWKRWSWEKTWGWDFPMVAMTATRLGMPGKAIDALFMKEQTNTYLNNGHNYQDERLRLYLPGNGGLLMAVALMCAGYDGCKEINPGIPKDGRWKVRWEGLKKLP